MTIKQAYEQAAVWLYYAKAYRERMNQPPIGGFITNKQGMEICIRNALSYRDVIRRKRESTQASVQHRLKLAANARNAYYPGDPEPGSACNSPIE